VSPETRCYDKGYGICTAWLSWPAPTQLFIGLHLIHEGGPVPRPSWPCGSWPGSAATRTEDGGHVDHIVPTTPEGAGPSLVIPWPKHAGHLAEKH